MLIIALAKSHLVPTLNYKDEGNISDLGGVGSFPTTTAPHLLGYLVMAPKRSVKAAPRASKQTPVLSMLLDSPSRGGPSRTNTTSGSSASLGHRTLLAAKPPNGLRNDFKSSFSSDKKGKSRDTTNDLDLLWCDRFAPREKVSSRAILSCASFWTTNRNSSGFPKGRCWYTQEED